MSQILRRYLTKKGRVRKFFYCLIWIKEPCVRKFEGLARSKILGISQTTWMPWALNGDIYDTEFLVKMTFIKDNLLLLDSFLLKTTYISLYLLL